MTTHKRVPPTTQKNINELAEETNLQRALERIITLSTMPVEETGSPTQYSQQTGEPLMSSIDWKPSEKIYGTAFSLDKFFDRNHDLERRRLVSDAISKKIQQTIGTGATIISYEGKNYACIIDKQRVSVDGDRWGESYANLPFLKVHEAKYL
jgi:hypothetical protein